MKFYKFFYCLIFIVIILSGCDTDKIAANEEVIINSDLVISSDTLIFTDNENKELFLSAEPASEINFQIIESPDWVEVTPKSGTITENAKVKISVTSNFENLISGVYQDELIFKSASGTNAIILKGTVNERFAYSIPDSINFPFYKDSEQILIKNQGNIKFDYTLASSNSNIEISASTGKVLPGANSELSVIINRDDLEGNLQSSEIYVTVNEIKDTITVNIGGFEEGMYYFDEIPIDAEYSKNTDQLVYVTENSSLYIYEPLLNKTESIDLPFLPTCISLSPDGSKALIGHEFNITYVDLVTKEIINTIEVYCKASDIVLGLNGWAYVFPGYYDPYVENKISCIDLNISNPEEKFNIGSTISNYQKAKLDPSGNFIYMATTRSSPLEIDKFDLQDGVAKHLSYGNTERPDNYADDGDLWISDDGNYLFTKNRDIFKTHENGNHDIDYLGTLNLIDYTTNPYPLIQSLDHSMNKNNLYIIVTGIGNWEYHQDPYLLIYNFDSMSFKNKIELNKHYVKNFMNEFELSNAKPLFVFSSSTGSEVYVITEGFYSSNSEFKWAIQTIDIQ